MAIKKRGFRGRLLSMVICSAIAAAPAMSFAGEADIDETNEAYEYVVDTGRGGIGASGGISSGGWASLGSHLSFMKFPQGAAADSGAEGLWCYCIDISTDTKDGHKYSVTSIEAANYYDKAAADKIRAILKNSYPHVGIDTLAAKHGLEGLTEEEAFMATQWILWYYSNPNGMVDAGGGKYYPANIYKPSDYPGESIPLWHEDENGSEVCTASVNAVKLAKALDALGPASAYETEPAELIFEKMEQEDRVRFDYGNSKGAAALEDVRVEVKDAKGSAVPFEAKGTGVEVKYSDIQSSQEVLITVTVKAIQRLSEDVYFFSPEGGREASQSRVAVYAGKVPISASEVFSLSPKPPEDPNPPEDPEDPNPPEDPEEPNPPEDPEDPNPPEDPGTSDAPKTGDETAAAAFAWTAVLSLLSIGRLLSKRRA